MFFSEDMEECSKTEPIEHKTLSLDGRNYVERSQDVDLYHCRFVFSYYAWQALHTQGPRFLTCPNSGQ